MSSRAYQDISFTLHKPYVSSSVRISRLGTPTSSFGDKEPAKRDDDWVKIELKRCVRVCVYTCIYAYLCEFLYVFLYVCACIFMNMCVHKPKARERYRRQCGRVLICGVFDRPPPRPLTPSPQTSTNATAASMAADQHVWKPVRSDTLSWGITVKVKFFVRRREKRRTQKFIGFHILTAAKTCAFWFENEEV